MRKSSSVLLSLGACAGLLAGGGALAAAESAGTAATRTQTLHASVPFSANQMHAIDNAPKGPSFGDMDLDLAHFTGSGAVRSGVFMQTCALGRLGKKDVTSCQGGIQLPHGDLQVGLTGIEAGNDSTYAITGGTGAYATARGTVLFHPGKKAIAVTIRIAG